MFENVNAELILENGKTFKGRAFGRINKASGELIFSLGAVGYQETITDPAYAGQIVVMSYPLVGNYGFNLDDMESGSPKLAGLIVREKCDVPNNWRCEMDIDGFFKQHNIVGVEGIDTRALTRLIREEGTMKATIKLNGTAEDEACCCSKDLVGKVTAKDKYVYECDSPKCKKIAVLDLGVKASQLREINSRGACVTVYPARTTAAEILADNPDGVFISNGPGSPDDLADVCETVAALCKAKPVLGVGLGNVLIAKAFGCTTKKLKYGHHTTSCPVKQTKSGRIFITNQNSNYAVDKLSDEMTVSYKNINDGEIDGIEHKSLPVWGVAFYPQTENNPTDTGFLYEKLLSANEQGEVKTNA